MQGLNQALREEHQLILKYIDLMPRFLTLCEEGKIEDDTIFSMGDQFIAFIQEFADGLHHAKEEEILFERINRDGVLTHCNPVGQMLYEHDLGRKYVARMKEGVAERNLDFLSQGIGRYIVLLQDHIYKEDNILYPMSEEALACEDMEQIRKAYIAADLTYGAKGLWARYERVYEDYLAFVKELETRARTATA